MPKIVFDGRTFEVARGERLRDALLKRGSTPHAGRARWLNCRGLGSCGTCALRIRGPVEPASLTAMESWRLRFAPHDPARGLRLACQVRVAGDLELEKLAGFWGQGTDADAERGG